MADEPLEANQVYQPPSWEQAGTIVGQMYPDLPEDQVRQEFDRQRNTMIARDRYKEWEPPPVHTAVQLMPFVSTLHNARIEVQTSRARSRIAAGKPEADDYDKVAQYERVQQLETQRTGAEEAGHQLLHLPAMAGEAMLGGEALGLASRAPYVGAGLRALGIGVEAAPAVTRAGQVGAFVGRTAAQTAVMPSMYVEGAIHNNLEAGRDAADWRGLPPAFTVGMIQTAILGSIGQQTRSVFPREGMGDTLKRLGVAGPVGFLEQNIGDVLASAAGLQTGYGTFGAIYRGENDSALKQTASAWLAFTAFSAMHEGQASVHKRLEDFTTATRELARRGIGPEVAGQQMQRLVQEHIQHLDAQGPHPGLEGPPNNLSPEDTQRIFGHLQEGEVPLAPRAPAPSTNPLDQFPAERSIAHRTEQAATSGQNVTKTTPEVRTGQVSGVPEPPTAPVPLTEPQRQAELARLTAQQTADQAAQARGLTGLPRGEQAGEVAIPDRLRQAMDAASPPAHERAALESLLGGSSTRAASKQLLISHESVRQRAIRAIETLKEADPSLAGTPDKILADLRLQNAERLLERGLTVSESDLSNVGERSRQAEGHHQSVVDALVDKEEVLASIKKEAEFYHEELRKAAEREGVSAETVSRDLEGAHREALEVAARQTGVRATGGPEGQVQAAGTPRNEAPRQEHPAIARMRARMAREQAIVQSKTPEEVATNVQAAQRAAVQEEVADGNRQAAARGERPLSPETIARAAREALQAVQRDSVLAEQGHGESHASLPATGGRSPGTTASPTARIPRRPDELAAPTEKRDGIINALQTSLAPATIGGAEATAGVMRENLAKLRRAGLSAEAQLGQRSIFKALADRFQKMVTGNDAAGAALADSRDHMENWVVNAPTPEERTTRFLHFTDALEGGKIEGLDPKLKPIAEAFRKLQDQRTEQLRERDLLHTFITDYFGHLWTKPGMTGEQIGSEFSRRPLAGSENYRKERTLPTYRDGIAMGLEPVSWNPVELMLLKFREIDKSIMGRDTVKELKSMGLMKFFKLGEHAPEGWTTFDDKLSKVFAPPLIPMHEFYDVHQRDSLMKLAQNLGVDVKRVMKFTKAGKATPATGQVEVAFGTGNDVLAHELGHIIDKRYGLAEHFAKEHQGSTMASELSELAAMRHDRIESDPSYQRYVQSGTEKIANLVAAYLHAPEMAREIAPNSVKGLEAMIRDNPELKPLGEAKPSMVLGKNTQERRLAGPMLTGNYYGPAEAMKLINNHLGPSMWNAKIRDLVRDVGGAMNNFQLGFSAFHAGFVTFDSVTSSAALGLQMISRGDFARGLKHLAILPSAPFRAWAASTPVAAEFFRPGSQGAEMGAMLDSLMSAGYSLKMDKGVYGNDKIEKFREGLKGIGRGEMKNIGGALYNAIPALSEAISYPVMEVIVPRMKTGIAVETMRYEMEKNPGMTIGEKRQTLGKIWDSVENRLGQMTYDNLFWNRTLKDSLMMGVRSVGWNLGTWRELGGGVKDIPESLRGLRTGQGITPRTAYLIALPMVTAVFGSLYTYMATGKPPDELKDYFFPKTGNRRADGSEDRVSLPSYMRDVAALTNRGDEGPLRIAGNVFHMAKAKLHPLLATVAEMLSNEDYYGTAIHDPRDSQVRQSLDLAGHVLRSFTPFSVRQPRGAQPSLGQRAQQMIGITPAPGYIVHTAEEQRQADDRRRIGLTPLEKLRRSR